MMPFGLVNLGILPLLLEAMTPAYAQHDPREQESRRPNQEQQGRPERQQEHGPERQQPPPAGQEHAPPARTQEERARPQEARPARPALATHQEERPKVPGQAARAQPVQKQRQQPVRQSPQQAQRDTTHRTVWQEHRAKNWQSEHHTWQDRGGYKGYHIPDARYRGHFGPSHGFRMSSFPLVVVGGFPRFQFGGFWFSVMDPWPEYWADGWYGTDDLYVEFSGGGYYLCNRRYPTDLIALTVRVS
jgi:hypothetical protein